MDKNSTMPVKPGEQSGLAAPAGSTAAPQMMMMTDKEELAVIVERLKKHRDQTADEGAKVRLDLAADLVRFSIHRL